MRSPFVFGTLIVSVGITLIIALGTSKQAIASFNAKASATYVNSSLQSIQKEISSSQSEKPKIFVIQPFQNKNENKVSVIMYHHILGWQGAEGDAIEQGLRVSPEIFERHLLYIQNEGYTTITTKDLYMFATGQLQALPPKPILLTFDDGYTDNATLALPLLQKYKMKGDFAIITGLVGNAGYMTWDQVHSLVKAGSYISSHTVHHCQLASKNYDKVTRTETPWLSTPIDDEYKGCSAANSGEQLTSGKVRFELRESKKMLENELKIPIVSIVYPFGGHNDTVVNIAAEEGYQLGFTVVGQTNETINLNDALRIPRYRGFGQDGGQYLQGFFAGYR